jgi:hypothetical protein
LYSENLNIKGHKTKVIVSMSSSFEETKQNMKFLVFFILFSLVVTLIPNFVYGEQEQVSKTDFSSMFYTLVFTILGGIGIAAGSTYFAWQRERRIPPTAEQERIIQEIIKEWYSNNFLEAYHDIWKKIENSDNQEKAIDEYWEILSVKRFPEQILPNKGDLTAQINYYRERLHISKKHYEAIESRIRTIRNIADVEYFASVRLVLPSLVDSAVMATINSKNKADALDWAHNNYDMLVESSIKNLKKLMIFYRVRENKEVCKSLVRAKLNERILDLEPISLNDSTPSGEI